MTGKNIYGDRGQYFEEAFEKLLLPNGTAYAGKSTMVRLLAQRHDGIECGENYHDALMEATDPVCQPNLGYFQTMGSWHEFVSRSPEDYVAWLDGCSREAAQLEIVQLLRLSQSGKKIFVDTNIAPEWLKKIASWDHVAILLSPQSLSVERFFDRPDAEKQFLYRQILEGPDPEGTMANFRACVALANSRSRCEAFVDSGFFTHLRTEESTIEGTLAALETHFGLC